MASDVAITQTSFTFPIIFPLNELQLGLVDFARIMIAIFMLRCELSEGLFLMNQIGARERGRGTNIKLTAILFTFASHNQLEVGSCESSARIQFISHTNSHRIHTSYAYNMILLALAS